MSFVKLPVLRHGLIVRDQALLAEDDVGARIDSARRLMNKKNVASLLVYGDPTINGPVSYLTNYPCFGLGRRATVALGIAEGPFLFTAEPSRNLPKVRLLTTCDLEKTRQFLTLGCERARKLSGDGGRIGLVGMENLPSGLIKDAAALAGLATEDLSRDFFALIAAKDESAFQAQQRAIGMVEEGCRLLAEAVKTGKDLWEIAADVDYRLRMAGCEDTNILLGSGARETRPGYPTHFRPRPGDKLSAYIAVMYGRQWAAAGRTLNIGPTDPVFDNLLEKMAGVQENVAAIVKTGMTLGQVEEAIVACGREAGLTFAADMSSTTGIGFDLHEYPLQAEDRVPGNAVLQVAMTADSETEFTGMLIDLLRVQDNGSVWITKQCHP